MTDILFGEVSRKDASLPCVVRTTFWVLLLVEAAILLISGFLSVTYLDERIQECDTCRHSCDEFVAHALDSCKIRQSSGSRLLEVESVLSRVSLCLTAAFLLEHFMLIGKLRVRYLRSKTFIIDLLIIVSSLWLQLVVERTSTAGMLLFARFWRFSRTREGASGSYRLGKLPAEDEVMQKLRGCFTKLSPASWEEVKHKNKYLLSEDISFSDEEKDIVEMMARSPATCLRVMAIARDYALLLDEIAKHGMRPGYDHGVNPSGKKCKFNSISPATQ